MLLSMIVRLPMTVRSFEPVRCACVCVKHEAVFRIFSPHMVAHMSRHGA
jgi:hypothetical protein